MTEKNLSGKVVIVTGAGGGLGRAMISGLAEKGARLAVVDIDEAALEAIAQKAAELGGEGSVLPIVADVGLAEESEKIFQQTLSEFGTVHVLVNNAGIAIRTLRHDHMNNPLRFWEADVERWQRLMDVNFHGAFMLARQVAPHMIEQGWGRIVNVTTSLDTMLRRHYTPYGPSKAALEAASCAWAQELDGTGVSVNVLVPGGLANTGLIPEDAPVDRSALIQPEVMTAPICWLASDESDGVTNCRFVGRDWDTSLSPSQAAEGAKAPTAWQGFGTQAVQPELR
jgi:3-oxoacyl-[acyl-carrier protein] reductase